MSYRDELEAALAHATTGEEDLAVARAEINTDEKRIVRCSPADGIARIPFRAVP